MKTRTGKIAQLPKPIRDQLNQRLENGQPGPELLRWLNGLPKTKKLLAKKFDNQPITKSNLSDWRHGGFLDWRADQAREARIQRLSESGASLQPAETGDLFENFVLMAVAELAADLDSLPKLRGQKRSQQLHNLVRDLARLQNGHNRSRWAELAWTKWNHSLPPTDTNASPCPPPSVVPGGGRSCSGDQHDPPAEQLPDPFPIVHHTKCDCGEPCPKCHAPESEYPLDEVLRDRQFYKEHGRYPCNRHGTPKHFMNYNCNCFCDRCAAKAAAKTEAAKSVPPQDENPTPTAQAFPPAGSGDSPVPNPTPPVAPNKIPAIISNPQPLISPLPLDPSADFLRKMALLKSARIERPKI